MNTMAWKKYEEEIYRYFSDTFPETTIKYNQKIIGKYSKVKRQIDILIEGTIAGYLIRIIVDCKYFSRKVDVKEVESFSSMIEDVGANQGILITRKEFTAAAANRAYYGPRKVELDILNFDVIENYQGLVAFPYSGNHCVFLSTPLGWVIDIKNKINSIASLYQRGLTLEQAQNKCEWMYLNFWHLDKNKTFTIDDLVKAQNDGIKQIDPKAIFEYKTDIKGKCGADIKIRIATIKSYSALEVTGFIKFEEFIFFAVMFTPKEFLDRNLRKVYFLLSSCIPGNIEFDNSQVIEQLLHEIDITKSFKDKSNKYHQIGIWYVEMHDYDNALINFKKSLELFPTHFTYLKHIIDFTLSHDKDSEAIHFSSELLSFEPKNPSVPLCLIEIFLENEKENLLIKFFKDSIKQYEDLEIKGNIQFHLGHLYLTIDQNKNALDNFLLARDYFKRSLPRNHYIFRTIDKILKQVE